MAAGNQAAGAKFQQYQQATSQLLAIQQQQKQNVAQASTEEAIMKDKNTQLLQSSEYMAQQVAANNVLTQQAAIAAQQSAGGGLNPATAATLSQYGMGQPKQQRAKTTNTSKQQQTKQKVIINNKTENIIYNDVKVPANIGGPVQGRPIQIITDKSKLDGGLGKFKSWLNDTFNKQNEASAKRQREYRRKDAELTRSANKLSKNLSDTTKSLGDRLDPKHVYRDIGSAFKNVLLLFGLAKLAREWPNLITKLNDIETRITDFFTKRKEGITDFFSENGTLKKTIVRLLGGKENETVGQAFKALLFDEREGLFPYIRKYLRDRLDERAAAIKTVQKPDFSLGNLSESIASLGSYLSDILAAILSPKDAAGRSVRNIESQQRAATAERDQKTQLGDRRTAIIGYDQSGQAIRAKVYDNDRTLINREYSGLMRNALDAQGNLTNHASSYYSQSTDLRQNILAAQNGNINTASVGVGFERLYQAARNHPRGKVPVSMDFVQNILTASEIQELGLKPVQYTYVIRQRPAEEIAEELRQKNASSDVIKGVLEGVLGTTLGAFGSVAGPAGTVGGATLGVSFAAELGDVIKEMRSKNVPRYQYELVSPHDVLPSDFIANEGNRVQTEETPLVYEVTPDVLTKILEKFTGTPIGGWNISTDNKFFMSAIEAGLMRRNKSEFTNKQLNIEDTYAANELYEQHRAEEQELWNNNRINAAGQNIVDMTAEARQNISERVQNMGQGLRNSSVGSLFSNRESAVYNRGENRGSVAWSDIRINRKDDKKAHEGSGPIGRTNIDRNYLLSLLEREIGGEFGRKEGNANGVYMNAADGGDQAGHGNYGYGNTYITLKKWYTGPVKFKLADGTIKSFDNLNSADSWFVNYCKQNNTTGLSPANKKVVLTDDTAKAINNKSLGKFVDDYIIKLDPDIMGAMDEQTLGGIMHIAYGGQGRFLKLVNFYRNHKQDALDDLRSNNGVHTEDFVNRVMMNTEEGSTALHTAWNGHHTDRRGFLTGYQTFNYYATDDEWENHIAMGNNGNNTRIPNNRPQYTPPSAPAPVEVASSEGNISTPSQTEVSTPSEPVTTTPSNYSSEPFFSYNTPPSGVGPTPVGVEPSLESYGTMLPEVTITPENYSAVSTPITTANPVVEEIEEDRSVFIKPVISFTEKLINIDELLTLMVQTSGDNVEASMNVLDAIAAKRAADSHQETPRQPMAPSYTAYNNPGSGDPYLGSVFSKYGNLNSNTIG